MPSIPFYADDSDFLGIVEYLNADDDIAFIVSAGPKSWKAVSKVNFHHLQEKIQLWHIAGGPLPLVDQSRQGKTIKDPFSGWEDPSPSDLDHRRTPYFGPGCPVIFELVISAEGKRDNNAIGISTLGWIGNHYSKIGNPAPESTKEVWERLRKWISKNSKKKITRSGPLDQGTKDVYAFSGAYEKFLGGMAREENP